MSRSQFRILLPWQSLKASPRPANESSIRSSENTDEAETSASAADTVPNIRHQPVQSTEIKPEQPPLAPAQAPEKSEETMPPSKSHKEGKVHSQPPSHSRAKNQTRKTSKPSKVTPQASVASNKSPSVSGKASPSHDTSKPSSPAGKAFPSQDTSKPSSPAGKASPSQDASKPLSPAVAATAPRSRIASKPPSPSQTSSTNHLNSKSTSQSRLKADSQPSSSSRSAFPTQASSMPRSPSQENSRQQQSEKTSRVQSPSHLSSKPAVQSTSQQPIESPAAIGDQPTHGIISHPANQLPKARPTSRESQLQTKSKQSLKPTVKPVESKASKSQPETKEKLTSKNTSNPHSNQDSSETPTQSDQTIENGLEPSLESKTESKETKERKNDKEDLAKTTNALQTNASRSTLITSFASRSLFEPEKLDSQQEETVEDLSKAFQKLNIKYSDEENPKSFTTLIGDNKGASMHLLSGEGNESSIHIHRQYKINPDQRPQNSTDIEENSNNETPQDSRTEEDPPLELYININVQGINNSIMSNSSFAENNPGIKLKLSREPTKSEDELQSHYHARKAKYTAEPAERLTYEPTVRRRCLTGLLMESSDSEVENPENPRRHGCRFTRSCKGKEVEIQ